MHTRLNDKISPRTRGPQKRSTEFTRWIEAKAYSRQRISSLSTANVASEASRGSPEPLTRTKLTLTESSDNL